MSAAAVPEIARPESEWHEDMGPVLWWKFPIEEAPYVGTPLDLGRTMRVRICCGRADNEIELTHDEPGGGWPGYHTHFTPLPPLPIDPTLWCVHAIGPDEIYAAASRAEADDHAAALQTAIARLFEKNPRTENDPTEESCAVIVIPWPYSAAEHAASLARNKPGVSEAAPCAA